MPKLLADFLLEQQEPFALQVYLVERGYPKRLTLRNSAKYVAPNCSYFVRAVVSQFAVVNANGGRKGKTKRRPDANGGRKGKTKRRPENAAEDVFPAASSSCSECDAGGSHCCESAIRLFVKCGNCFLEGDGEVDDADTTSKLRGEEEDCKQLSPISVFGETDSDEESPIFYKQCNFNTRRVEQPSSSTSKCRLKQPRRSVFRESRELDPYDQYIIKMTSLQQREQLLIDCTQELIEKCRKKENNKEEIKAEEIRQHVCEKVLLWSQDSTTECNIVRLLHSYFWASVDEWNAVSEQQKFEICKEIENAILDNVIDEIITWLAW